ncbi:M14 family metallocarboxypeptidase [Immundisolibacter sp.]|uniref:M14 family metallopeptidase n=1 Tax=Immundisolibacter sp. TaxID=1934948 RepID=UPI00262C25EC|nr:M14 family metallocarboxypeptidase [Immundisolibacter sp.]MDD3650859.1 M14 family metallocarboxypeptidase [Immundisolibacter sp.]
MRSMRISSQTLSRQPPAAARRALAVCLMLLAAMRASAAPPTPPLEAAGYTRYSRSDDIAAYLDRLVESAPALAHTDVVGHSVQGRPIEALRLATGSAARLKVLLVGSQHGGAEPAGGEALLEAARELIGGDLRPLLDTLEVILIPNANPDGRDLRRRSNANRVNINTDFVLLTQPESRALVQALHRYAPQVVVDLHESAVLKRQSLAREGYLTDFDAQVEIGNNPALPAAVRTLARDALLPALLTRITAGGLPAQRYIGEITSTRQPVTHGGLTLRNFRNTAAATGALSLLIETKLDPHHDRFDSYRNIAVRVQRQMLCIRAVLAEVQARRAAILARTGAPRPPTRLALFAGYAPDPAHPTVTLPLRRLDSRLREPVVFADHRRVVSADRVPFPARLYVTAHTAALAELLDRHLIRYRVLSRARRASVRVNRFDQRPTRLARLPTANTTRRTVDLPPGSLDIDLAPPGGLTALLLLDPRSPSSVFRYPDYGAWLQPGEAFFVYHSAGGPR